MISRIKAVIFDLGGVLVRTVDPSPRIALADQLGTTRQELERVVFLSKSSIESEMGRISVEAHWQWVIDHYGQKELAPMEAYQQFFSGDILDQELIAHIQKIRGKWKTGLVSNAWKNSRNLYNERFDFLQNFDVLIFSSEVGVRKPDPRIFRMVLNQLDIQPQESIFVDDFEENIAGARRIGMQAILFTNTEELIRAMSSY